MRIIAFSTLRDYFERHIDTEPSLREWYKDVKAADWAGPNDVKQYAASVSILSNDRVCFNIKGNKYRLIVAVAYSTGLVYIKWVGTHADYMKINAEKVEFGGRT